MKGRISIPLLVFLLTALLLAGGKGLFFYKGTYQERKVDLPSPKDIVILSPHIKVPSEILGQRAGTLLVDFAHDNNFGPLEMNTLLSRAVALGFTAEFLRAREELERRLRYADAFVVVSPGERFSSREIALVEEFVRKGGKLLLIEDPTRRPREDLFGVKRGIPLNDLASQFGIVFERDYLYNMKENEGNYRHVFFTKFGQDELTKDLTKIVFYSAGSISGSGKEIVIADENTFSSSVIARGKLSPLVLAAEARVLSIHDLSFMTEPFNGSFDNNRLISNVIDWLTRSERDFYLSDFPDFLAGSFGVAYADASLLRYALDLTDFLQAPGKTVSAAKYETNAGLTRDTVFLVLTENATEVKLFLEKGKIRLVETDFEIAGIGRIPQQDTSLVYLDKDGSHHLLVVLAHSEKRLEETLKLLKSGDFRKSLASDRLAIIQADKEETGRRKE